MKSTAWLAAIASIMLISGSGADAETECSQPVGADVALDIGIEAVLATHNLTDYRDKDGNYFERISYDDLKDFLARNTNCCAFSARGSDGFLPSPEWQKRNSFYGFVSATFKAYRVKDGVTINEALVSRLVAITTCGKAIWYNIDDDNI